MNTPRSASKWQALFPKVEDKSFDVPAEYKNNGPNYAEPNTVDLQIAHVFVQVKPGTQQDFIKESMANASESVKEEQNVRFDLFQDVSDDTKFMLQEIYSSPDGPKHHKTTNQ